MRLSPAARIRRTVYTRVVTVAVRREREVALRKAYTDRHDTFPLALLHDHSIFWNFVLSLTVPATFVSKEKHRETFFQWYSLQKRKIIFFQYFILSKCVWARIKKYVSLIFVWRITYCSLKSERDSWVPFFVSYRFF